MPGNRPSVVSAKLSRLAEIIADADELKAMPKSDRPNSATLDDVRKAYVDATTEVASPSGSVAEVEDITLPRNRL